MFDTNRSSPWRDRLEFDPAVSETSPIVRGTRVTAGQVVAALILRDRTWSDLLGTHPGLELADILACLDFDLEPDWIDRTFDVSAARGGAAMNDVHVSARWSDRLALDPAVSESSPVVRGTRVTVQSVVAQVLNGRTWSDILHIHPELVEDDIRACLAFYITLSRLTELIEGLRRDLRPLDRAAAAGPQHG